MAGTANREGLGLMRIYRVPPQNKLLASYLFFKLFFIHQRRKWWE